MKRPVRVKSTPEMISPTERVEYSNVVVPRSAGGTPVAKDMGDVNAELTEGTDLVTDLLLVVTNAEDPDIGTVTSSDGAVATVSSGSVSHEISYVSSGRVEFTVEADNLKTHLFAYDMKILEEGGPFYDIMSYEAGTLAEHCHNNIAAMISGKTASNETMDLWTTWEKDVDDPTIVRNTSLFMDMSTWDASGISVMNSNEPDSRYPVTLVTPRHGLIAEHVNVDAGERLVFMRPDNSFQTVTILRTTDHPNVDMTVLYFDQAVTGCKIHKVLSASDWATYAPSMLAYQQDVINSTTYIWDHGCIPAISWGMHKTGSYSISLGAGSSYSPSRYWGATLKVTALSYSELASEEVNRVRELGRVSSDIYTAIPWTILGDLDNWRVERAGGDSASPIFLPIDGELVYITSIQGGANADTSQYQSWINNTMNDMADAGDPSKGSYALTAKDLSGLGFTTYP